MLLVPPALSAVAVPLVRRHPVAAWTLWSVMALATAAGAVLLALMAAFVQTVFGAGLALVEGDPDGSRGHVDLMFLVPWVVAAAGLTVGSGLAVRRAGRHAVGDGHPSAEQGGTPTALR